MSWSERETLVLTASLENSDSGVNKQRATVENNVILHVHNVVVHIQAGKVRILLLQPAR